MSFFSIEQHPTLEREKQQFLEGKKEQEDLAVYTWGEESYDGLGDALQEGGDELNDETFGEAGQVGELAIIDGRLKSVVSNSFDRRKGFRFHSEHPFA
jgi:hypothetical protein